MKKWFVILFLFLSLLSYSQITILGESIKEKTPKETKKEIPIYDSLSNFIKINDKYEHLIGQRVFCYKMPLGCYFSSDSRSYFKQEIEGKYFSIIKSDNKYGIAFKFENNDIFHISESLSFNPNNYFIVEGYFEKAKALYVGKLLVFVKDDRVFENNSDRFNGLFNMETRKRDKTIKINTLWNFTGVSIEENAYCILDDENPVVLTLSNEDYGEYYCFLRSEDINCDKAPKNYILGKFLTYEDYVKKEEADLAKAKEREEKEQQRIQALVKKYGQSNVNLALQGSVKIGWNKELCREAWGEPNSINRTTTTYGVHEQWVYSTSRYLYFDDGVLTAIQE
jgi:hypothetical protein